MATPQESEVLTYATQVWAVFLIGLYAASFMNEYHFPGFREEPLEGEEYLWKMQRVLFFGLLVASVLVDIVRMRVDRQKAFQFLFISLILGGLSSTLGAMQFKAIAFIFSFFGTGGSTPAD